MKLGFVGIGNMGAPMARRLLAAGHELVIFDREPGALTPVLAEGARAAVSLTALAAEIETVLVSLPTPAIVEQVVTGPSGIGEGAVRTVVDLSTTGPEAAARIGTVLEKRGIAFVDAPVSGGTVGAEAGTLSIMISGEEVACAHVRPALEAMGKNLFQLGKRPGQAQMMKLINNMMCAAATVSAFEGLVLGAKAGLDARTMLDVVNASSGQSFATSVKIPQCVVNRSFPMRFATALLDKDVRLCLHEGERLSVPMMVANQVRQFLSLGMSQGYGEEDYGNLIKIIEGWAGTCFGEREQIR